MSRQTAISSPAKAERGYLSATGRTGAQRLASDIELSVDHFPQCPNLLRQSAFIVGIMSSMSSPTRQKACVILGAGASYDVVPEDSQLVIEPVFRPPLTSGLFDIAGNRSNREVIADYPGAQVLAPELDAIGRRGADLESALRHFAEHPDPQTQQHFKQIPAYIRDVLQRSSEKYAHYPHAYLSLVRQLLGEYKHDVLFLVLNYDTLLEWALTQYDSQLTFQIITDYVAPGRRAAVVKMHGSVNWFNRSDSDEPWLHWVRSLDVLAEPVDYVIDDEVQRVRAEAGRDGKLRYYPILTAPLAGKDFRCPNDHIFEAGKFLFACKKFLIVGTSGKDDDLHGLLNKNLNSSEGRYLLHIVGGSDVGDARSNLEENIGVFREGRRELRTNAFSGGFRGYLAENHLETFASF